MGFGPFFSPYLFDENYIIQEPNIMTLKSMNKEVIDIVRIVL